MQLRAIDKLLSDLFSEKWAWLHEPAALRGDRLKNPGVYLLAYSKENLVGRRVREADVLYVGMSNAAGGIRSRLKQFRDGIERNGLHSGAQRFYREHGKGKPFSRLNTGSQLFYAALTLKCVSEKSRASPDDLRELGHICCLEYYAIAKVRERTNGKMPSLNKLGPRPAS